MKLYWLVPLVLAGVLLAVYLLFMGLYYPTSSPTGYCVRCHYIKPYVESWQESKHAGINCAHCHEHRGFGGKLESKARGSGDGMKLFHKYFWLPAQRLLCFFSLVGTGRIYASGV